jgi:hypothetical protein
MKDNTSPEPKRNRRPNLGLLGLILGMGGMEGLAGAMGGEEEATCDKPDCFSCTVARMLETATSTVDLTRVELLQQGRHAFSVVAAGINQLARIKPEGFDKAVELLDAMGPNFANVLTLVKAAKECAATLYPLAVKAQDEEEEEEEQQG